MEKQVDNVVSFPCLLRFTTVFQKIGICRTLLAASFLQQGGPKDQAILGTKKNEIARTFESKRGVMNFWRKIDHFFGRVKSVRKDHLEDSKQSRKYTVHVKNMLHFWMFAEIFFLLKMLSTAETTMKHNLHDQCILSFENNRKVLIGLNVTICK